ncbi:hypothetical protein HDU67_006666 [Dinochytrium kinnereticum]|nr:hypothetical protein HDU67_006666 [Dinochytrium kinnereticum]
MLSDSLRHILRPFTACAKTVLITSLIIIGATSIFLVITRFFFLWTCISKNSGKPFSDDSIAFGTISIMLSRTIAILPVANKKIWLSPSLDYCLISICGYAAMIIGWMFQPYLTPFEYLWKTLVPVAVINGMITSLIVYPRKKEPLFAQILRNFGGTVIFFCLFGSYFSASIACLNFSNRRIRSYLNNGHMTLRQEVSSAVLNLFFLGFIFPLLRYAIIWLNKTVVPVWKNPKPKTRLEEIAVNASKLVFVLCQELIWSTIGNIVIFRSPTYRFYYLGTLGFQIAYAVERLVACYNFKRKMQKELNSIEPTKDIIDPTKPPEAVAKEIEEQEEEESVGMTVFEPSRKAINAPLSKSATGSRISRMSSSRSMEQWPSFSSRVEGKKNRPESEYQSKAGVVFQIQEAQEDDLPPFLPPQIRKEEEAFPRLSDTNGELLGTGASSIGGGRPPTSKSVSNVSEITHDTHLHGEAQFFGVEIPFIPVPGKIIYGYLRLGSMVAEWTSRGIAFAIILIFVSLPEFSNWTWYYTNLGVSDLIIRLITWPVFAIICEVLCTYIESKILDLDFALSVQEFKESGLSLSAYVFLVSLAVGCCSIVLIAETGVFVTNPAFEPGRRQALTVYGIMLVHNDAILLMLSMGA